MIYLMEEVFFLPFFYSSFLPSSSSTFCLFLCLLRFAVAKQVTNNSNDYYPRLRGGTRIEPQLRVTGHEVSHTKEVTKSHC